MLRLRSILPALTLLAVAPAAAHAEKYTLGSSLVPDASVTVAHPRDWGAYTSAQASGSAFEIQAQGEISYAQLKGSIVQPSAGYPKPNVALHVVVVRPQADGTQRLMVSTEDLPLPYGGDPNQVTDYDLQKREARICVKPGDHVALATNGGFGDQSAFGGSFPDGSFNMGAPFRMFGRVPGSSYDIFKQPDAGSAHGWQVGDDERFERVADTELLMRFTLATGPDARYSCETPEEQKQGYPGPDRKTLPYKTPFLNPVDVPEPSHAPYVKSGKVPFRIYCRRLEGCDGTLTVARGAKVVGTTPFKLSPKQSGHLLVSLAAGWRSYLPRKGAKAKVTVTARLSDGKQDARQLTLLRKK